LDAAVTPHCQSNQVSGECLLKTGILLPNIAKWLFVINSNFLRTDQTHGYTPAGGNVIAVVVELYNSQAGRVGTWSIVMASA
jgi:hypothetical protein